MCRLQNLMFLGFVGCSMAVSFGTGCTVGSDGGSSGGEDASGGKSSGGSTSAGGSSSVGGSAAGGATATYQASDCAASSTTAPAAAYADVTAACITCIYTTACTEAVTCHNTTGCIGSLFKALECDALQYVANGDVAVDDYVIACNAGEGVDPQAGITVKSTDTKPWAGAEIGDQGNEVLLACAVACYAAEPL